MRISAVRSSLGESDRFCIKIFNNITYSTLGVLLQLSHIGVFSLMMKWKCGTAVFLIRSLVNTI